MCSFDTINIVRNIDRMDAILFRYAMFKIASLLFAIAALLSCTRQAETITENFLVVNTDAGYVSGALEDDVYVFKGVPFAAPPVGALRWRPPQRLTAWTDTLACTVFGASPMQPDPKPFMMWTEEFITPPEPLSEDCLFLNIWSGAKTSHDKLPVFVWIHGGAFQSGSGACAIYDGAAMAKAGIVYVSINYRLGVFGFLAHPELTAESDHNASGNYGLMDQLAALEWIKRNIASFGGDPDRITIGGQSAGSMSVQCLIASPLTKGLVAGAIAESGAGFRLDTPLRVAEGIGTSVSKSAGNMGIEELRQLGADSLLRIGSRMPFGSFFPVIDGYVLTADMRTTFKNKQHVDVPLMAGWVTGDAALVAPTPLSAQAFSAEINKTYGAAAPKIRELFPANDDKQAAESQQKLGILNFAGLGDYQWALANRSASYLYEFSYIPTDKPGFPNYGAFHTSEVPYALRTLRYWDRPWTETDYSVEKSMSTYWLNFIRNGDPNGDGLTVWSRYDVQQGSIMQFDDEPSLIDGYYQAKFELLSADK